MTILISRRLRRLASFIAADIAAVNIVNAPTKEERRLASFIAADIAAAGGNVRSNKKTSCETPKVVRSLEELPILTQ